MKARKFRFSIVAIFLIVAATIAGVSMFASSTYEALFPDVQPDTWFFEPVSLLASMGVINGMGDGTFKPEDYLTAGQFLKLISVAFFDYAIPYIENGKMLMSSGQFIDINHWASPYYRAAIEIGVLAADEGSDTKEYLDGEISRYDVSLILIRTSELVLRESAYGSTGVSDLIRDYGSISTKYQYSVSQAYAKGLITGYDTGNFAGSERLTRAQAATVVLRLMYPQARVKTDFVSLATATPDTSSNPGSSAVTNDWFSDSVFIGDSLTDGFRRYAGLSEADYLCSTGASVYNILSRTLTYAEDSATVLSRLETREYSSVFIMLGINEIGCDPDDYRDSYEELIATIRDLQPGVKIYIQSVLPVTEAKDSSGGVFTISRICAFNDTIVDMCKDLDLIFIDTYSALADSKGFLPADCSWDGIHLQIPAYEIWLDYLKLNVV